MKADFKLDSVKIEGFKGFTSPVIINFSGKSTFIFGPNGWGKSSILEAVSWCLWGRDNDEDKTEIRNLDYYSGECKVELGLIRGLEHMAIVRRFSVASGESPAYVVGADGRRQNVKDVLPQIRKLGSKGARVLFSQQGTTLKWQGDLDKFKDVINAYLELDRLEKIRSILNQEKQDAQDKYDKELKKGWKKLESSVNERILKICSEIDRILNEPPWDDITPPTNSQTTEKLLSIYSDICKYLCIESKKGTTLVESHILVKEIETLIKQTHAVEETNDIIEEKREYLKKLQDLRSKWTNIKSEHVHAIEEIAHAKEQLTNIDSVKEIQKLTDQLNNFKVEEEHLAQLLAKSREAYEEAKQKKQLEEPKLVIEATQLKQRIANLHVLDKSIEELNNRLQSMGNGVDLSQLRIALDKDKARLGQKSDYLNLINNVEAYCKKYGYEKCPICEAAQDITSHICKAKDGASQDALKAAESVRQSQDLIIAIEQAGESLQNFIKEKAALYVSDPNPELSLSVVNDKLNKLTEELFQAESKKSDAEVRYSQSTPRLRDEITKINAEIAGLDALRVRLENCENAFQEVGQSFELVNVEAAKVLGIGDKQIDFNTLQNEIEKINTEIAKIEGELDQKGAVTKVFKDRLVKLRYELDFHDLLKKKAHLVEFKEGDEWKAVEKTLNDYLTLANRIGRIIEALDSAYAKSFDTNVKAVNDAVQIVYKKLTAQQSYPDARVRREVELDNSNEIVMEVGIAERDKWRRPNDVLNEQARHAVALVPYFAFSELGMLQHDLDFLLIDDPSQSFDSDHLEELIHLLSSASKYSQIILATHEVEKYEKRVREKFGTEAKFLCVNGFNPQNGPTIVEKE